MTNPDCVKCRTPMELGFLLDNTHGGKTQSAWIEGEAVKSMWTGLDLKGRQKIVVTTFRCPQCGYLESYARQSPV
jgi:hypothetical protein